MLALRVFPSFKVTDSGTNIKGIAQASGIQILTELMILPKDMSAGQWVAYAGLDPRLFESGSSVEKKPRISKVGNKYIRQALYMPALVATRFEPNIKGYYAHLNEDNGLKKIQATVCHHAQTFTRYPWHVKS